MLDLETIDTTSNAAILSIGAVQFDLATGKTGETFYRNVELQSCLNAGLTMSVETLYWWLGQSKEAGAALQENRFSLKTVCIQLTDWFEETFENISITELWANGPDFDCVILTNAFKAVYMQFPIRHWQYRNLRNEVARAKNFEVLRIGNHHNALDDCFSQIGTLHNAWTAIKVGDVVE